jgi:hypothetical protein
MFIDGVHERARSGFPKSGFHRASQFSTSLGDGPWASAAGNTNMTKLLQYILVFSFSPVIRRKMIVRRGCNNDERLYGRFGGAEGVPVSRHRRLCFRESDGSGQAV